MQQSRWLPSVVMGALLPTRQATPRIKPQGGLSPPVQQSRKLPSDAVRVPPSVASLCLFSFGRGSPLRCSRAAAPFGCSVTPPSVCYLSYPAYSAEGGALTPSAAESRAPFGRCESPPSEALNCASYSAEKRGLSLPAQSRKLPSVAVCEPAVCRLSYAVYSAADEALPPGAAEPLAPFGCMGALHPMRQTAPRISLPIQCRTGLSLLVKQSLGSLRSQCVSPPSVVGVMLRTQRRTRLSLPVQQSCRLPSVRVGALHPTRQTAPRFQSDAASRSSR